MSETGEGAAPTSAGAMPASRHAWVSVAAASSCPVTATSVAPDASNEITIALTPGPNNNNANHFTYLGVLQILDQLSGRAACLRRH